MASVYITSYSYNLIANDDPIARARLENAPPQRPPYLSLPCMNWQPVSGQDAQRYSGVSPQIQNHIRMQENAMAEM
jgi:hypothetical protein